jgi:hypothetical protein
MLFLQKMIKILFCNFNLAKKENFYFIYKK